MTLHLLAGFTVTSHVSDHSWVGGRTKAGFWDRSDVGGPDLWEGPALADRWGRAQHLEGTATTTGAHSGPRCKALRAVGLSFLGPHCGSLERRLGALRLSLWVGGDSDRLSQCKPCSLLKSAEWGAAPGLVPLRACNGIGILLREEMPFGCTNSIIPIKYRIFVPIALCFLSFPLFYYSHIYYIITGYKPQNTVL